jgi:hypothetical protein
VIVHKKPWRATAGQRAAVWLTIGFVILFFSQRDESIAAWLFLGCVFMAFVHDSADDDSGEEVLAHASDLSVREDAVEALSGVVMERVWARPGPNDRKRQAQRTPRSPNRPPRHGSDRGSEIERTLRAFSTPDPALVELARLHDPDSALPSSRWTRPGAPPITWAEVATWPGYAFEPAWADLNPEERLSRLNELNRRLTGAPLSDDVVEMLNMKTREGDSKTDG